MLSDDEFQDHDEKKVDEALKVLMHSFDATQIFVTRQEPDGRTMAYSAGRGNFYSRWGVIHEWCSRGGGVSGVKAEEGPETGEGETPAEDT